MRPGCISFALKVPAFLESLKFLSISYFIWHVLLFRAPLHGKEVLYKSAVMKKIKYYFLLLLFMLPICGIAQNWAPLGHGLEYPAFTMFADSVDNRLYIGGNFKYAFNSEEDTVIVYEITAWNGNKYVALGEGNSAGNCTVICPPIRGIARFRDEVYADLQDVPSGSGTIYGIARWNGERWDSLQGG